MLAAMRPGDPRYAAVPLPGVDARVRSAVLCWPVIDPLGRYHYAQQFEAKGLNPAGLVDRVLPAQLAYWGSEEAMAEGSPLRILERGEQIDLPPVLFVQSTVDVGHPHLDRFVELYRAAGGRIELELVEADPARHPLEKAPPVLGLDRIVAFVHAVTAAGLAGASGSRP